MPEEFRILEAIFQEATRFFSKKNWEGTKRLLQQLIFLFPKVTEIGDAQRCYSMLARAHQMLHVCYLSLDNEKMSLAHGKQMLAYVNKIPRPSIQQLFESAIVSAELATKTLIIVDGIVPMEGVDLLRRAISLLSTIEINQLNVVNLNDRLIKCLKAILEASLHIRGLDEERNNINHLIQVVKLNMVKNKLEDYKYLCVAGLFAHESRIIEAPVTPAFKRPLIASC